MMSKITANKANDLDALRAARQTGASAAGKNKTETAETKIGRGEDTVRFSESAARIGKLVDELKQMPDVREAKINGLREQIAAGEYNPSSEQIADAFLKEER